MTQCTHCGRDLAEHEMDIGFQLPDVVWGLPEAERAARTKYSADLCVLDETRHFLRGVVYLPVRGLRDRFGLGLWAEVTKAVFDRYLDIYDTDATHEPDAYGVLANAPASYESMLGHGVTIHFGLKTQRPTFALNPSDHLLCREQREGISDARLHELVSSYAAR
jgi:hypothetical protein